MLSTTIMELELKYSSFGLQMLRSLKSQEMFKMPGRALEAFNIDHCSSTSEAIYVRSFHHRLFNRMWENRRAVLIGNPGISKTYFQFYIMHCDHLVNNINVIADKYNN